ncbi:MAG: DUF2085 domain-containing protein [Vicinamibacteria bacterium]
MLTAKLYALLFEFLGVFCHQMPERSWIVFGAQAPLCIRCSAILLGSLAAAFYVFSRYPLPSPRLAALLASPLLADVAAQVVGLHDGSNGLRFATGASFGFSFLIGSLQWLAGRAELARAKGKNFYSCFARENRLTILTWVPQFGGKR